MAKQTEVKETPQPSPNLVKIAEDVRKASDQPIKNGLQKM